jgi:H+/Cl- antiporter ClcA
MAERQGTDLVRALAVASSVVALLVLTKAAGYGVSLGSGFRGGPVFPAFLGAAVGTFFSLVVPGLELTPAVVAGMAGLQASTLAIVGSVVAVVLTLASSSRQANLTQKQGAP